jgi:hypothetical protein
VEKYRTHDFSKLEEAESADGGAVSGGVFAELMHQLNSNGNTSDRDDAAGVSKMRISVHVERTTRFYMLNYVLMIATLTAISWVVFIMPAQVEHCTLYIRPILQV